MGFSVTASFIFGTPGETIEDINKRDSRDSSRESSPLGKTDDMVNIDSTSLTIEEVVERIMGNLKKEK